MEECPPIPPARGVIPDWRRGQFARGAGNSACGRAFQRVQAGWKAGLQPGLAAPQEFQHIASPNIRSSGAAPPMSVLMGTAVSGKCFRLKVFVHPICFPS